MLVVLVSAKTNTFIFYRTVYMYCMFVPDYLTIGRTDVDAVFRKAFVTVRNKRLQKEAVDVSFFYIF